MKKTLALILAALMLLCMVPASVFADAAEEPDEAAAIEFNHKICQANQLDALFGRHESIAISFVFPEEPERDWFAWETEDCVYQEWGTRVAQFDRDRVVYAMNCDEETGAVSVSCGVNVDPDYDPFYSFVPETDEEFFDPAHDHVTQIQSEGGVIQSASQYDETLSRQFIENVLGREYSGQTIRTEISLDAETYEVLSSAEIMVQDGRETLACVIVVEYDTPEPLACRTLRAAFERSAKNMMTVSFAVDPGSDHEIDRQITVPVNTDAGMMFGYVPFVYFNDPDGETLSHWDRMSDLSLYIYTNPDEELTGKFQTLYEGVLREMQPKEPDAATFEKLVAANAGNEILSRHNNAEMTRATFRDGEEILSEINYRDAGIYIWRCSDGVAMLHMANTWVNRSAEGEGGKEYCETIFDTLEAAESAFADARDEALIIMPEEEPLQETFTTEDGRFVAVTEISDAELVGYLLEETESLGGYAYAEGMSIRFRYTFDAESGDLLRMEAFLTDADGVSELWQDASYAYDVEAYDPAAEGEPFAAYFTASTDPELSRTIIVTFAPDTENERVIGCNLPKNARFSIFCDEQYVEEIYTDRACAQLFEGSDGMSNLELYVK